MSTNNVKSAQSNNIRFYAQNPIEKIYHEIQVLLGKEVRYQRVSAQKHLTSISNFKVTGNVDTGTIEKATEDRNTKEFATCNKAADSTESKKMASTKPNEEVWYEKRDNTTLCRVRVRKMPRLSIWLPLALIVLRMIFPEIEGTLPHVYMLLDEVVIPFIEWLYKLVVTLFRSLMNNEFFMNTMNGIVTALEGVVTF